MAISGAYLPLFIVFYVVAAATGNETIDRDVTYEDVLQSTTDPSILLVDVRRPDEVAETGIIPSAIHIPLADFKEALSITSNDAFLQQYHRDKPRLDSQMIIYCQSGVRALEALNIALDLGYINAKRYPGSWKEWSEKQNENASQATTS